MGDDKGLLEPGTLLDNRYEVVNKLGEGGMATIYLVRHLGLRSLHALKVPDPRLFQSPEARQRFTNEGRIQALLRHPHIAQVTDIVISPVPGLVMEYVEGGTLGELCEQSPGGRLDLAVLRELFPPVLGAMEEAHGHRVVHRDLTPGNILLSKGHQGRMHPKVTDFGIAKVEEEESQRYRTRTGVLLGTRPYMSPEQIRGAAEVDARTDIFALGAILYEAVTGRVAFDADSDFEMMTRISEGRYTPPEQGAFTVHMEGAPSPFNASRHFVRVGVQGKVVSRSQRKPAHLVFLVDTSGSMNQQDKLPLAKEAMKIAVKNLNENDTVALVTYAGGTRDVLSPTPATDLERIYKAIDSLESGGGTAMGTGMELAYKHAVKKASANVVSRVVVLTDGDANIGPNVSADTMLNSIQGYVKEGVTLSAIGFGMGNYRDDLMERLANKGNGNSFYIDSEKEARRVFQEQLGGTLEVIAKDVKVQVEFDPKVVRRYRLVGYENRDIADKDFRDDKVDAGEIGAGHSVTAVYEVELTDAKAALGTVRIRAKTPSGTEAAEQAFAFEQRMLRSTLDTASTDFRFALAVAATADVLRGSPSAQGWNLATVQKLAEGSTEGNSDREEFVKLVTRARGLLGSAVARDGR